MPRPPKTPTYSFGPDALESAGALAETLGANPSDTAVTETLGGTQTGITGVMRTVRQDPAATANLTGLGVETVPEEPEEQ